MVLYLNPGAPQRTKLAKSRPSPERADEGEDITKGIARLHAMSAGNRLRWHIVRSPNSPVQDFQRV